MSQASRQREITRRIAAAAALGRPRNSTASQRLRGEPPLCPEEWTILRVWQTNQLARLCGPWQPIPPFPPRALMAGEHLIEGFPLVDSPQSIG